MSEKIDPRYDPVFQRGYTGDSAVRSRSTVTSKPTAASQAPPSSANSMAPQRQAGLPPSAAPGTDPMPEPDTAEEPAPSGVTVEVLGEEAEPARRTRLPNPFIVLLWVLGLVLAMGGSWAAYQAFLDPNPGYMSQEQMALRQFLWVASPALVTVGLGIIGGLLFWHAASWRHYRR